MDDRMLQAARRGDRSARRELLLELQDSWYRLCMSQLRDSDRAAEATQETALRFLRKLPEFDGRSQLKTWSFGIAINVAREMQRQRSTGESGHPLEAESPTVGPVATVVEAEEKTALHAILTELPERQRLAVVLRFFEEMSVEQTAAVMQCAEGTVKATIHQALRQLRRRLAQQL